MNTLDYRPAAASFSSSSELAEPFPQTQPAAVNAASPSPAPFYLRVWFAIGALLKKLSGEIEFTISERHRGYLRGLRCEICRLEAHDTGEMCPKQWAGLCDVCGPVLIDYYGNCQMPRSVQRTHRITRRWKATEADWRRPRLVRTKPRSPTPAA